MTVDVGRTPQRVLVVEDEAHIADGIRFNLEQEGYEVEVVGDGRSGVELLTDAGTAPEIVRAFGGKPAYKQAIKELTTHLYEVA